MAPIDTSPDGALPYDQQASGSSIFWALVTLAFGAMQQPSFCGYLWDDVAFENSFWPHRSSPIMCIVDAIIEVRILLRQYRDNQRPSCRPQLTVVATRLCIFVVAILPQAIKLFSMSGIPISQGLASIYLLSLLVSMVRTTCQETPHSDLVELVREMKESSSFETIRSWTCKIAWAAHLALLYCVWYQLSDAATIEANSDIVHLIEWIWAISSLSYYVYILVSGLFKVGLFQPLLPRWEWLVLLPMTRMLGLMDILVDDQGRRGKRTVWENQVFTTTLLLDAFVCSLALASLMGLAARALLGPEGETESLWAMSSVEKGLQETRQSETMPAVEEAPEAEESPEQADIPVMARPLIPIGGRSEYSSPDFVGVAATPAPRIGLGRSNVKAETDLQSDKLGPSQEAEAARSLAWESPRTSAEELPRIMKIVIWLVVLVVGPVRWLLEARERAKRRAQVRRAFTSSVGIDDREPQPICPSWTHTILWKPLVRVPGLAGSVIRSVLQRVFYGIVGFVRANIGACEWAWVKIQCQPSDTLVLTMGILNLGTAMAVYLGRFDGTGTETPAWTAMLG